ncbi:MAG: glycosyltransferase [Alphaproteobacteria bacterium]|nr:glycosyltransferase [Alphaproteobacteria bacterium]
MSKISVIVPVYNVEQYLPQCLDSIINQTYKNLEIICVDDGSPDNSGKILDEYAKKDKRIKVIHQENGGLSVARNTGLDNATGEWVSFIDSDDYIALDFYENLISAANKSDTDVVQCGHSVFSTQIDKTFSYKSKIVEGFVNIIKNLKRGYVWNKLWKRELIESNNLRFYPKIYIEDILFSVMTANFIKKFSTIDYVGNFYRSNPNSISQSPEKKQKIKEDIYLICCKALDFAKAQNRNKKEIKTMSNFLIKQLISVNDLIGNNEYKKYKDLFGNCYLLFIRKIKSYFFYFNN